MDSVCSHLRTNSYEYYALSSTLMHSCVYISRDILQDYVIQWTRFLWYLKCFLNWPTHCSHRKHRSKIELAFGLETFACHSKLSAHRDFQTAALIYFARLQLKAQNQTKETFAHHGHQVFLEHSHKMEEHTSIHRH